MNAQNVTIPLEKFFWIKCKYSGGFPHIFAKRTTSSPGKISVRASICTYVDEEGIVVLSQCRTFFFKEQYIPILIKLKDFWKRLSELQTTSESELNAYTSIRNGED
ncbi:unnamed protein product [Allacma fusca]|uniref:Uncharacterized protein n=1 Tax=Allacma fusca TaxID=39272 RepID=A0A8J2PXD9_9HEXA|nr:unnamed protein product [Allacma fusca]